MPINPLQAKAFPLAGAQSDGVKKHVVAVLFVCFRARSTMTRDRNLQFRRESPLDFWEFSPVDLFSFSPGFMCNLVRTSLQNVEKWPDFARRKMHKSCHVSGCHVFFFFFFFGSECLCGYNSVCWFVSHPSVCICPRQRSLDLALIKSVFVICLDLVHKN